MRTRPLFLVLLAFFNTTLAAPAVWVDAGLGAYSAGPGYNLGVQGILSNGWMIAARHIAAAEICLFCDRYLEETQIFAMLAGPCWIESNGMVHISIGPAIGRGVLVTHGQQDCPASGGYCEDDYQSQKYSGFGWMVNTHFGFVGKYSGILLHVNLHAIDGNVLSGGGISIPLG